MDRFVFFFAFDMFNVLSEDVLWSFFHWVGYLVGVAEKRRWIFCALSITMQSHKLSCHVCEHRGVKHGRGFFWGGGEGGCNPPIPHAGLRMAQVVLLVVEKISETRLEFK